MFRVSREFQFCYGHRLMEHPGKCAHLHGHNGTVRITLQNEDLNSQGMVLDFGDLKRGIGDWIETELDHRMILSERDPILETLKKAGEPVVVIPVDPTAENLAKLIFDKAEALGFPVVEVSIRETEKCQATYRR